MSDRPSRLIFMALLVPLVMGVSHASAEFRLEPTWQLVDPAAVYDRLEAYLKQADIRPDQQVAVRDRWRHPDNAQADLLDRLAHSLAKADSRVAELVEHCAGVRTAGPLPAFAWLAESDTPELVRHNMRLYFARWLVQQGYYDEAISWSDGLTTDEVVAPEALLFYRAVAHHQLVQPDEADAALAQLLQRESQLPTRYLKLAGMMRKDVAGLEAESLDHIARRMEDIRRRLALGRSGKRVQDVESGVIESLDKLIDKIEEQMQQQQSQASASRGGQQSNTPMEDSRIAELKAPGNVEPRDIGRGTDWGNLPDKDREKALQEIGREFPSHYREVIEEYFRRLAAEESADAP